MFTLLFPSHLDFGKVTGYVGTPLELCEAGCCNGVIQLEKSEFDLESIYIIGRWNVVLKLVKLSCDNYPMLVEMMDEWMNANEKIVPYAIRKTDYHFYDTYINSLEISEGDEKYVPDSTYFCLDTDRNIFVGAVNIRHYLNEDLLLNGGHIGDGIRPSERCKGYGTRMIALALEKCKSLNLKKVLMVCDKDNVASAKTIQKNNGILENEIELNGIAEQRYWITL